ncbi:MAG: hypothetical protein MMC33_006042 [Icmadophila ericetorum]|nr:hypothetical protein [Icmadophila ericetorum]
MATPSDVERERLICDSVMKQISQAPFRFASDNTSANRDTDHFITITKSLGFAPPKVVVIPNESLPGFVVNDALQSLTIEACKLEGHSLVICHYAGYGRLDVNKSLVFHDCCFAGAAVREGATNSCSSELIAAVESTQAALGNLSELVRVTHRTFTSRLSDYVAVRRGRNDHTFAFLEAVEALRNESNNLRLPCYHLLTGTSPIRVPLQLSSSSPRHRKTASSESSGLSITDLTNQYYVTFNVHLDVSPECQSVKHLVTTLQGIPAALGIEVMGVYKSRPTTVVFRVPWRV